MGLFEIVIIGVGLAMDAFAVSICKGISMKKMNLKKATIISAYFGCFQALMPLIGYFLGSTFSQLVINVDHWIAFVLLSIIGAKMLKDSFNKEIEKKDDSISFKNMILLAIATSIDALAIGITFAFFKIEIIKAVNIIGIETFTLSIFGVIIGNNFGNKFKNKAEFMGGVILILIGLKILFEHIGLLKI